MGAKSIRWNLRGPLAALALLGGLAGPAHAGLFDDEEARKAILDLRARLTVLEDQNKQLQAQVGENAQARRSLLDLNNQLESLRSELAQMRGEREQLQRDLADLQRLVKDASQSVDDRLRRVEPQKVTLDGQEFQASPEERQAYEQAIATMRSGDFDAAANQLTQFGARYPGSGYQPSARFWLGNALYGKRDYKGAIAAFRDMVDTYPQHPKAAEALLAMANSQAEMKDSKAARRTLDELLKRYPDSEAAAAGKDRLASLR
jgi:tol-pal system protein YbgF